MSTKALNLSSLEDLLTLANVMQNPTLDGQPATVRFDHTRRGYPMFKVETPKTHAVFPVGVAVMVIKERRSQFLTRN